jgi:large subunit ribosomal protein L10
MKRHLKSWKKNELNKLKEFVEAYDVLAVADLNLCPANLLQNLRKKLKGKAEIKISKLRIVKKALSESKKNLKQLLDNCPNQVALIGTNLNAFELYSLIKKNKVKLSAAPGMIAPNDIIIPAGDTGLPLGPALGELKSFGLKAKIVGNSITIEEDKLIVKKSEIISEKIAGLLSKLNIKPINAMLSVKAVMEGNQFYLGSVLDFDSEQIFNEFSNAFRNALNLSYNIVYPTKQNIELLLQKAFREAKTVSLEGKILNKSTATEILMQAKMQAQALQSLMPDLNT